MTLLGITAPGLFRDDQPNGMYPKSFTAREVIIAASYRMFSVSKRFSESKVAVSPAAPGRASCTSESINDLQSLELQSSSPLQNNVNK